MRIWIIPFVFFLMISLAGCNSMSGGSQGLWDSQYGASSSTVSESEASTAISVLVNNEFGQALDKSDHKAVADAQKQALRSKGVGASVSWQNEETGHSGRVRPGAIYQVNDTACREFTHEMVLNGAPLSARGTACRQENGSWKTLS
ncbi:RT0821/Lpp0805 family surface protein [Roseibium algae]|uniref:RT0821/Lpp0805 family surface protein n=1 Tax=Roseibium algae TaxID=3123038 RepID=A0ABU8TII9_9HYPH